MMNSYWWGTKGSVGRGVAWMRWERLCVHKEFGGMVFKDLYGFNLAMLAKFLKLQGDFLSANLGSNPSLTWRSVVEARLTVVHGCRWKVGDGRQIWVWTDPWVRRDGDMHVETPSSIPCWELAVSALMTPDGASWYEQRVFSPFHE
ncbi:Uncharacterized mitochondrial protein AtMg00310 [Linum grandiflorum]